MIPGVVMPVFPLLKLGEFMNEKENMTCPIIFTLKRIKSKRNCGFLGWCNRNDTGRYKKCGAGTYTRE